MHKERHPDLNADWTESFFYGCDRRAQIQKRTVFVPATQTKGVKKAISEFEAGKRDAVLQHVLTSSGAGKEPEEFTLIILEREDKKGRKIIHAFATSVSVDVVCGFKRGNMNGAEAFVEQYRTRWSIETGYRYIESMMSTVDGIVLFPKSS